MMKTTGVIEKPSAGDPTASMSTARKMGLSMARSVNHVPNSDKAKGHGDDGSPMMGSIVVHSESAPETFRLDGKEKGMLVENYDFVYRGHPITTPVKEVGYDSNNGRSLGTIASALQVDAPLSQSMDGALQVDAPLTQSMVGALQVEARLKSNPRKSMAGTLQVDAPLTQSMDGALQVEAPLNSNPRKYMAGALQVEDPLHSNPCHVFGSFGFPVDRNVSRMVNAMQNGGNSSQSEQNGQCKMDMEYSPHSNTEAGYNNGNSCAIVG